MNKQFLLNGPTRNRPLITDILKQTSFITDQFITHNVRDW